jgi:hypothetical protein
MRSARRTSGVLSLIAAIALVLPGCGGREDNLPRQPISGTVTFDGKPLKAGTIQFFPAGQQEGVAAGGFVTDGRFQVEQKDGPVPGKYSVMIFARDDAPQPAAAEDAMPGDLKPRRAQTSGGRIPLRYNLQTELKAEVKPGGPNTYAFVLEKP